MAALMYPDKVCAKARFREIFTTSVKFSLKTLPDTSRHALQVKFKMTALWKEIVNGEVYFSD